MGIVKVSFEVSFSMEHLSPHFLKNEGKGLHAKRYLKRYFNDTHFLRNGALAEQRGDLYFNDTHVQRNGGVRFWFPGALWGPRGP